MNFIRGVKLMLPPPEGLEPFFFFLETVARFGYNTVMLELGGAMEYKTHPEINEGWLEYAAFMGEYPGKGQKIQASFDWDKNSIHSDNGGGRVLSQDTIREIIARAESLGLEIIPEVPCLSHCDYLLTRHPELAERTDDPYPDTFCPSNPASYELLFDILGEVIDLFHPKTINIGHDEFYTIGICEKCRNRPAPEIYATDITKINDFLARRGVRTMIWAEKLLDAHFIDSKVPCGGAEKLRTPATFPSIDLVPRDLLLLHWYWSLDRRFEEEYVKRGFDFAFGNYSPRGIVEWKRRSSASGFGGYIISNWGRTDMTTLQRNGVLADVVLARLVEESEDPDAERPALWRRMFRQLFDLRYGGGRKRLYIRHTTEAVRNYRHFVDGFYIDENDWKLGDYVIALADGSTRLAPVIYGFNISKSSQNWNPPRPYDCDCNDTNSPLAEVAYTTLPVEMDGHTEYIFGVDLPDGVEVASVEYRPLPGHEAESVRFEVLGRSPRI
jgi:hexosaminidase